MSIDRLFATRDSTVRSDEEFLLRGDEAEEEKKGEQPAPGKSSRTHTRSRKRGPKSAKKGQPGKSPLTTHLGEAMVQRSIGLSGNVSRPARQQRAAAKPARAGTVMRKATRKSGKLDLESFLKLISTSKGKPLSEVLAQHLSNVIGHDIGHARIHDDAAAAQAASVLGAKAFTVGQDVFFAEGTYAPASSEGQRLLVHELTHVKQHDEGRLPGAPDSSDVHVSDPSQPMEREAEHAASQAASASLASTTASDQTPASGKSGVSGQAPARAASAPAQAPASMAASTIIHREAGTGTSTDSTTAAVEQAKTISLRLVNATADVEIQPPLAGSHTVNAPGLSHPGTTVDSVDLTLDQEGALQSGKATVSVDAQGAVKSERSQQDISVDSPESGTIQTEVKNATSSLGEFIDGISVDARLIEGGVEAEITISQGTIAGVQISGGTITARYQNGAVSAQGELGLSALNGKFTGNVTVSWENGNWSLVGKGTVSDLFPDLQPFEVEVSLTNGQVVIRAADIQYSRTIGNISMTGRINEVNWDQATGAFAGSATLDLDLGSFGKAVMNATIENNILANATVEYTSPELRIPKEGEPVLSGQLGATFTYENNQLSAVFNGTANLGLGGLTGGNVSNLALQVDATLNPDGSYAGTIGTTETLQIGNHFAINGMTLNLTSEGNVTGDFTMQVVDVPFLSSATITGRFGENGLEVDGQLTLSSSSVAGVDITGGTVNINYANGAFTGQGELQLSAAEGKLTGTVNASFDGQNWNITGTAQVRDLIPNLQPFDVQITYADNQIAIEATGVQYSQEVGGTTFTGTIERLTWDQASGGFNGNFNIDVDLGLFGQATATATIQNSALSQATVEYTQPEFKYPRDSATPVLTGSVQGSLTYDQSGISGTITGTASIAVGSVGGTAVSNVALQVNATLDANGTYGGTISTTEPVTIGEHFSINGMSLTITSEGNISGDFTMQVQNVPFVNNATVTGSFNENGLQLANQLTLSESNVGGLQISGGTISLNYANGAITGQGQVSLSAAEGKLSGTVDIGYDGQSWTVSGTAQVRDLIPNLQPFDVTISYAENQVVIQATGVEYSQTVGAVSFTGRIERLVWDQANGGLAGDFNMDVDLGLFGQATATAAIQQSSVSQITVNYNQPEFRYPRDGESPVLTGAVQGTLVYDQTGLSGTITGTSSLAFGNVGGTEVSNLALQVNATLNANGTYSGTIATTEPLAIGNHFTINGLTLNITPEGAITGNFDMQVVNMPFLSSATVTGSFNESGIQLASQLTLSEGNVGGIQITGGAISLNYAAGAITGEGDIQVSAAEGKLSGTVHASFDGQNWTVNGTAQVRDLIPNLQPFDVALSYANDQIVMEANGIQYSNQVGAVSFTGTIERLVWDQAAGGFSGNFNLDVDLGLFGQATATATIDNNSVSQITVNYNQPDFRYPKDSGTPALAGSVQGTLTYDQTGLSGTITGTANLAMGSVAGTNVSNVALQVNATLNTNGTFGGTIATTEPVSIGAHFTINGINLAITPEGNVSGGFDLQVVDVPFLSSATARGTFDQNGVQLASQLTVSSGSVSGINITGGSINLNYAAGAITGQGQLQISAAEGKLTGTVNAAFDGQNWTLSGTAQVQNLIPNLQPFDVQISYENGQIVVQAQNIEYNQQVGAITLTGTIDNLVWNQETGGFSGSFGLDVDLALFGAARATANIENNQLTGATVEYTQPEFKYPRDSATPALTGSVQGTFTFDQTGISGTITGSATLAIGNVAGAENLALQVNAQLNSDGTYSGTVATTASLQLGNHFVMNGLSATINSDGSLAGTFDIEVINVPFLSSAKITGTIDQNGVTLGSEISVAGGSVGGVEITSGTIAVTYANGMFTGSGTLAISALGGKLTGNVTATYDGQNWAFSGTASVNQLIPQLQSFEVSVSYANDQLVIEAQNVEFSQTVGAISFTGRVERLVWDQATNAFSGNVALDVDLGLFGKATAAATIENNQVSQWTVEYTTPELRYPKGSDSPVFTGQITGSLAYQNDQLTGTFNGTANIAMPQLVGQNVSNLGLQVNAALGPDGNYSGTIATTERLQIGDYFAISGMSATLEPDGSLRGEFSVEVVNLPYLQSASITCSVDETGVHVTAASAQAQFGDENSRAWGTVGLSYQEAEGFIIDGNVNVKLSEGMVAKGQIRYTTATNEVTATLGMDPIPLINMGSQPRTLFEFDQDIIIFTLYQIIGLYLDVGFDLSFNYNLNLSAQPEVTLAGLSLEDWSFDEASAEVGLLGALGARLTATPHIGIGAFAGHPKILRGGGGVGMPIVADAALNPQGTFGIRFRPGGGVEGDAKLGLVLTFEIKGSVVPYAEFSVLDGVIQHTWQGDSLADFEILPKRELFNYTVDFGALGEEPAQPQLPTSLQEPTPNTAGTVLTQETAAAAQTPVSANRDAAASSNAGQPAANDPSGFNIGSMVSGLMGGGSLGALREVFDAAGAVWESIQNNIEALRGFFANWFNTASGNVQTALRRIQQEGFIGFIKSILREQLGDDVYYIFEPLLEAAGNIEQRLIELLNRPIGDFNFDTMLQLISGFLGLAWDSIPSLVRAIGTIIGRAADAGRRLIGRLVTEGKIGVRRHEYYILWHHFLAADEYKIQVLGINRYHREDGLLIDPDNAIAGGLWHALRGISSIQPTNMAINQGTGEPYMDYWV